MATPPPPSQSPSLLTAPDGTGTPRPPPLPGERDQDQPGIGHRLCAARHDTVAVATPVALVTHLEDRDNTTPIPYPHEHLLHPIALAILLMTPVRLRR